MVKELKIGTAYKTLYGFNSSKGRVEPDEVFTLLKMEEYLLPDPYLEYPPPRLRMTVFHNGEMKEVSGILRDKYSDLEEII